MIRDSEDKVYHTPQMYVRLSKKEWTHPSLITPKSANFAIGLDEASLKYAEVQKKDVI